MKHRLQGRGLVIGLTIEELNLQEVLSVIEVVSYKVHHELLDHQTLINLHILVKTGNQRIHLFIDRGVVSDLCLNYGHLLWLRVLSAKLRSSLAILIYLLL